MLPLFSIAKLRKGMPADLDLLTDGAQVYCPIRPKGSPLGLTQKHAVDIDALRLCGGLPKPPSPPWLVAAVVMAFLQFDVRAREQPVRRFPNRRPTSGRKGKFRVFPQPSQHFDDVRTKPFVTHVRSLKLF